MTTRLLGNIAAVLVFALVIALLIGTQQDRTSIDAETGLDDLRQMLTQMRDDLTGSPACGSDVATCTAEEKSQ